MKALNGRQIEVRREVTQAVVDELIDALPWSRPFDLVSQFTLPMPIRIICRLLDVRVDDAPTLGVEVGELGQWLGAAPMTADQLANANAAALNSQAKLKDCV